MCMLTYSPPGELPSFEKLREAGKQNPDGFGWAIVDYKTGRVFSHRTLDLDESLMTYAIALGKHDGPSLWHARWATHGSLTLDNVHPFTVDGGRTVIGHNGIMPIKERGKLSDTHTFAADYWPRWARGAIDNAKEYGQLAHVIGASSKLVILTVDPRYQYSAYIVGESMGHWVDGTWYSNHSYEPRKWPVWNATTWTKDASGSWVRGDADDEYEDEEALDHLYMDDVTCGFCQAEYLIDYMDDESHYCPDCGTCFYCDKANHMCRCYHGRGKGVSEGYEGRTMAELTAGTRHSTMTIADIIDEMEEGGGWQTD